MSAPKIKFDLQIKYGSEYGPDEERAVLDVLRQGAPTSGDACIQFEKEFAAYCGTAHARAVSNGTAALFLSLVGLGIKPGDRILTTPMTWIATAAAGVGPQVNGPWPATSTARMSAGALPANARTMASPVSAS